MKPQPAGPHSSTGTWEDLGQPSIRGLYLGALGERGVLGGLLLADGALLPGPLGALGVGGVARGLVLALLLHHGLAFHHIVGHLVGITLIDAKVRDTL